MNAPTALTERANSTLHEALLGHLPPGLARDARILDVGCGTGAWLARLAEHGYSNLEGIDYDTAQVGFAGARIARVDLNQPDWAPLSGTFRLITAIEVIEHIENVGVFFDRLAALLAPDGVLLMTTPNVESLAARLRFLTLAKLKQFDDIGDATHLMPVLTHTLPRILERRRLAITASWGHPRTGVTLTSRRWVNWCCAALRLVLPEPIPGDNLCLRIGHAR